MLHVWTCRHSDLTATWHRHNDIRKKLIISFCRYVVMFRLCKLKTSENILRHNDITKNQSERLKNIEPSLPRSSTIFKIAAAEEVECVDEHMHPDINELLSEAVRRYPILYYKTLREFNDRRMKSNAGNKVTKSLQIFLDAVVLFWRLFLRLLIRKNNTMANATRSASAILFSLLDVQ